MNAIIGGRLEAIGVAVIGVGAALASGLQAEDAIIFFNYSNNIPAPHVLYFYGGYVHVIPEITAYIAHVLPFVAQPLVYRVVVLAILLLLYRELILLLRLVCPRTEAAALALACIAGVCFVEPFVLGVLAYTIWTALFAALAYALRLTLTGARLSTLGIAGLLLALLSNPAGIVVVPVLLAGAYGQTAWKERIAAISICAIVVIACAAGVLLADEPVTFDAARLYRAWRDGFMQTYRFYNLLTLAAVPALFLACAAAWWKGDRRLLRLELWLGYAGLATAALYLLSPRFYHYNGFPPRYIVILAAAALLAASLSALAMTRSEARPILAGAVLGFCLALLMTGVYARGRGPILETVDVLRFMRHATTFRAGCGDGDSAVAYVANVSAPIVLCRPRDFPPGMTSIGNVRFWTGPVAAGDDPLAAERLPRIYVGRPLF